MFIPFYFSTYAFIMHICKYLELIILVIYFIIRTVLYINEFDLKISCVMKLLGSQEDDEDQPFQWVKVKRKNTDQIKFYIAFLYTLFC